MDNDHLTSSPAYLVLFYFSTPLFDLDVEASRAKLELKGLEPSLPSMATEILKLVERIPHNHKLQVCPESC